METLLKVVDLKKTFHINKVKSSGEVQKILRAVDGLNFDVYKGETFGIVGESGCGKSTLSRLILRLLEPTSGKIIYKGQDIQSFNKSEMKNYRRQAQMIFQDPYSSFHPSYTVREQIMDVTSMEGHETLMEQMGLEEAYLDALPHKLSGGQLQRCSILRALLMKPKLLLLDEPTSALDNLNQLDIMKLIVKHIEGMGVLLITHDGDLAHWCADEIVTLS